MIECCKVIGKVSIVKQITDLNDYLQCKLNCKEKHDKTDAIITLRISTFLSDIMLTLLLQCMQVLTEYNFDYIRSELRIKHPLKQILIKKGGNISIVQLGRG